MKNLTLLFCFLIAGAGLMAQSAVSVADAKASKKATKVETAEEIPAAVMADEDATKATGKSGCGSKSASASKACCASKGTASASKMSATHVHAGVADEADTETKKAGCADKSKGSGKSCCASKGGTKADIK